MDRRALVIRMAVIGQLVTACSLAPTAGVDADVPGPVGTSIAESGSAEIHATTDMGSLLVGMHLMVPRFHWYVPQPE